MEKTLKRSKY